MTPAGRWDASRDTIVGGADHSGDAAFESAQIGHLLRAPLRHPFLVVIPWAAVLILSVVLLLLLPKRYKSATLILVESEKVPESFVPKVSTDDSSGRLEAIRPEILSRTRLERVVEETRPYPEMSATQAVEVVRRAVSIDLSGNDGFTLEFVHRDPHKAQEVTNRLATLFIDESVKARQEQVEEAVEFLVAQVKNARDELESKDATLRHFKEQRMGRLPEQLQTNLATMGMLQQELRTVEESLLFARERQESLARNVGRGAGSVPSATELADARRQLESMRGRYTEEHPDVMNLKSRIARLQARVAEASADDAQSAADTPTGVARDQVENAKLEVKRLEDKRKDLEDRIASLRSRVEDTPRTEQELATLTRDYQKLNENYVALLSKQLEAQLAGRLEKRWKGERFRILDPANLPEKPYFPKPLPIVGAGAVAGMLLGLGLSLVAEYLDPTVKDSAQLQNMQGYPVLACIPHIPRLGEMPGR